MVPSLPGELWASILVRAGPIDACQFVGVCRRTVAACRIQVAARGTLLTRHLLRPGVAVRVRCNNADPWIRGRVIDIPCSQALGIEVDTGRMSRRYFFLPNTSLRVRVGG